MGIKIINLPDFSGLPENGDYFAVTDGTVTSKLNYQLVAQAVIEQYEGSELAGSEQSVQDALIQIVNQSTEGLATKEDKDNNATYVKPSSQVAVMKKHGIVSMWTHCMNKTLAANTWYTLVTVASEYRPKEDVIYGAATIGNQAQYPGLVRVGTDGKVEVFCHTAVSGQLVVFNIMYAVAE